MLILVACQRQRAFRQHEIVGCSPHMLQRQPLGGNPHIQTFSFISQNKSDEEEHLWTNSLTPKLMLGASVCYMDCLQPLVLVSVDATGVLHRCGDPLCTSAMVKGCEGTRPGNGQKLKKTAAAGGPSCLAGNGEIDYIFKYIMVYYSRSWYRMVY